MTAQPNHSLARGIDVIHALSAAQGPIGTRELARHLREPPSRVSRLLGTLSDLGIAARTADRKYIPGPGFHVLAAVLLRGSRLLNAALPEIAALLADGHGAALGVAWRAEVCYLFHGLRGTTIEQGISGRGGYPLERSSIGRVITALSSAAPQRAQLAIRRQGFALSSPSPGEGRSVAVPIGDPCLAALAAILRPGARPGAALIDWLQAAAARIAARVDGRSPA